MEVENFVADTTENMVEGSYLVVLALVRCGSQCHDQAEVWQTTLA